MQWQVYLCILLPAAVLSLDGSTADMDNVSPVITDNADIILEAADSTDAIRDSRAVPGVVTLPANQLSSLPHSSVPVHGPHENFSYPKPPPVYSKAKCHVEQVKLVAHVCIPTVEKKCHTVKQKTKVLVDMDDCVKIKKTVCEQEDEELDNEVCYYEYNMEQMDGEAKTINVDYEIKCEDYTQELCPNKPSYGHSTGYGYCKKIETKVCYNEPKTSETKEPISVGYPVPNKKCESQPVKLPKIVCREMEEEKCISLPYTKEEVVELERCSAVLGPEKCEDAEIIVPKQICEEIKEHYAPPPPAYHAPAPAYHAPAPAYHAPTPAYHAPAPAYHAPAPAYHAPAPAYHAPNPAFHGVLPTLSG